MRHELKSWPQFFKATLAGAKTFEIRNNDRKFEVHDEVVLLEWDPETKEYTGRTIEGFILYISDHEQKPGYVVFSIDETRRTEE